MAPPASASSSPAAPAEGAPAPAAPAPAVSAKPRVPSLFSARDGEDVGEANPFLGDLDGDGFDDFFIMATLPGVNNETNEFTEPPPNGAHIYLFYGRSDFPTRLTTADADAVFEAMLGGSGPLGDINGDGYADFAIQRFNSVEFVFGSPQRLRGRYAEGTAGVRWMAPPPPPELGSGFPTDLFINAMGDYNGDGCAEVAVIAPRGIARNPFLQGLDSWYYVVLGRRGSWPSGTWDPKWAAAHFAVEEVEADPTVGSQAYEVPLSPIPAGDLDADGYDDLIVGGAKSASVLYGGRPLTGEITAAQADASFIMETEFLWPVPIGDADGDGADDLLITGSASTAVQLTYGRRWSGKIKLQPDLSIFVAGVGSRETSAAAGDIDGDGSPEIVIAAANAGQDVTSERPGPPRGALYVVRGTGKRLLGEVHLTDANLLLLGPKAGARSAQSPFDGGVGWTLSMTGDVDGDGGLDILTSSPNAITSSQSLGGVFLVPSTPKTPL